jgi:hypothetical protein
VGNACLSARKLENKGVLEASGQSHDYLPREDDVSRERVEACPKYKVVQSTVDMRQVK